MPADEKFLGEIHTALARRLLDEVKHSGRRLIDPETGEEVIVNPDPRVLAAAIKFLKDNRIEAVKDAKEESEIAKLEKAFTLPFKPPAALDPHEQQ